MTAAVVAAGLGLAGPAGALTATWNTCMDSADTDLTCRQRQPSPRTTSGSGTTKKFTFGAVNNTGLLLSVRAYHTTTDLGTGPILGSEVLIFEEGLGAAPAPTSGTARKLDNQFGSDEILVFQFGSNAYVPLSLGIVLQFFDGDFVTYIGGSLGGHDDAFNLFNAGTFEWTAGGGSLVSTLGYTRQEFPGAGVDGPIGLSKSFSNGASGRYLIVGPSNEVKRCDFSVLLTCDAGNDGLTIAQVVGRLPAVAEPATLAMLGSGLVGIAATLRRRKRHA